MKKRLEKQEQEETRYRELVEETGGRYIESGKVLRLEKKGRIGSKEKEEGEGDALLGYMAVFLLLLLLYHS